MFPCLLSLAQARRFATGDARGLKDMEALNLLHPLVQAAIADARAWSADGCIRLYLPPAASAGLATLAGKQGLLCVLLVDYAGFEPVQSLVAAAVVDGIPIDPSLAAQILRLPAGEGTAVKSMVDAQSLDDAVDEAVFVDQRRIEEGENHHFERAIGQLERYVEDKVLVCRRERASITEKLRSARARRDEVVGASARERIEAEILAPGQPRGESRTPYRCPGVQGGRGLQKMARKLLRPALPNAEGDPPAGSDVRDRSSERGDVVLKLLHTADWHLGRRFPFLPEEGQKKLSRARIDVVTKILEVARRNAVNAILCVGDIFDNPDPGTGFLAGARKSIPDPPWCASATVPHSRQSRSVYAGIGVVAGTWLPDAVA